MRSKFIFCLLVLFSFLFFNINIASAQEWNRRFTCTYDGGTGECYVNNSTQPPLGCGPGFESVANLCSDIGDDGSACNNAEFSCVPNTNEEVTNWTYHMGGCIPSQDGEYASEADCESATGSSAPTARFKCNDQRTGCVACNPASDSGCNLTHAQCADTCRPSSIEPEAPPGLVCEGDSGIETAIGCIPFDPVDLTVFLLGWALGIGGGIALLMIVYAAIIIMTSSGDPKKVQGGRELLTAAVSGLLLIIFSTFILRLLGVEILQIF